ncbi:hypothetical protein BH09BAC3_BH09BAC3_25400 [soil metagenome]
MQTITLSPTNVRQEAAVATAQASVPLYLYVTVICSLSIMIGLVWDISWHTSIGRDGLFSAPHLAIYFGGVIAGLFSGYRVLKMTFAPSLTEQTNTVKFWGVFRASLGNLFCIWGAIAMLTSAPFDDWWHNTYGLDVTILSPPHTVLLLGMIMIQFGAIISVLSYQNSHSEQSSNLQKRYNLLFALSAGFVLTMIFTIGSEFFDRHDMHRVSFYQVAALLFPIFMVAFSMASKSKWGATYAAIVYSVFLMLMGWILPLFPATPRLGPVLNPITHFQPFEFPLLIIIPALLIDLITKKWMKTSFQIFKSRALTFVGLCASYGFLFLISLLLVQWPFANVLMASKGHWFFATSRWYFGSEPTWEFRYAFADWMVSSGWDLVGGLGIALGLAMISSAIGITWGNWMKKIVR